MTTEEPEPKPPPKKENPRPWPTYGYDDARQHISPYDHRPPVQAALDDRRARHARVPAHDRLRPRLPRPAEGPLLRAERQDRARSTGARASAAAPPPRRRSAGASSTSPTCTAWCASQDQAGADGFVVAWDADTGRERWRYKTAPVESSPLLHGNRLFVGSWDHGVHAINAKTGTPHLALPGRQPGEHLGRVVARADLHRLGQRHAVRAQREDRQAALELAARGTEFWYATPTVAYGRVYIGNTDGTMYVVRGEDRQAALGAPARQLHLRRRRGLPAQGLRGHLRRQVLRARRRHGRRAAGRSTRAARCTRRPR